MTATDSATDESAAVEPSTVRYTVDGPLARIALNRPEKRNAQNSRLLYDLDDALYTAAQDDAVHVILLEGAGSAFSAGHDIGDREYLETSYHRLSMWPDHVGKPGIESRLARESEVYLGLCRRWRSIPKPTIAMVQGACIGAGLMLAWSCDLVVAADDAFFADPVLRMGCPGVEYFPHPWIMGPRFAKEFLFLGERVDAQLAREMGMVNRVVPKADLEAETLDIAARIAKMPPMAITLTKLAVNFAEDQMGFRAGNDYSFALHQMGHAHAEQTTGSSIMNIKPEDMRSAMRWLRER